MSKAVQGAIGALELAGGIALEFVPGGQLFGAMLISAGVSTEAGVIASMIGSQGGMGVTTRTAAALRQIVRGEQRIGGTIVYCSTTGSTKRQYNIVIVLATHAIEAIVNLYLDGRQVFWDSSSSYNQTINGVNFGGNSDGNSHTGPNGQQYNFGGEVFCAAFLGKQNSNPTVVSGSWVGPSVWNDGDAAYPGFCSALEANDGTWSPQTVAGPGTASASLGWNASLLGEIDSISLQNPGANYPNGPVTLTIVDIGGTGSGAAATANAVGGSIDPTSLVITSPGANYLNPQVTFAPPTTSVQTPYLGGCSYVYLKVEADSGNFPAFPEIRFTVKGKNDIYDPRTGLSGYSTNWALNIADAITDPTWGLGDDTVNQDQLIAAANVCDEQVICAAGLEARYSLHWHYNSSTSPGDAIAHMMDAAEGRLSRIGGQWYIWPAYWQGPSFTFDANALAGSIQWTPKRPMADLCNRVTGTYIAANFPYNVAGDLYDTNGFFEGETQNNFSYAFQPSSYPMYAADQLHGYGVGVDVYLTQDGGIRLPIERTQDCVLSISQAQRLAKIYMLRNRQQGSGSFPMGLAAWQMQPVDVMEFNMPALSWTNKILEIVSVKFRQARGDGDEAPATTLLVGVQETDASVYEWDPAEELTPYDVQADTTAPSQFVVQPPASLLAVSDLATALVQPNGQVIPRIELTWTEPDDTYVQNGGSIEIQMCAHSSAAWQDVFIVGGQTTLAFLGNAVSGSAYDVRIRSVRANGATSVWVELDNIVCGAAFSATGTDAVAPAGTLVAATTGPTTSNILVLPFTAAIPGSSVACLPGGAVNLGGLSPQQLYFVYYIDPSFAGGAITPIATLNPNDFVAKPGYWLIGSILTPAYVSLRYAPSGCSSVGSNAVAGPGNAYDGNLATFAQIAGVYSPSWGAGVWGEAIYSGFAAVASMSGQNLYVNASMFTPAGSTTEWAITAGLGGGAKPAGQLGALNSRGAWAATTAYAQWDYFTEAGATYLVVSAYTSSGTFGSTDIANCCLLLAQGTGTVAQATYSVPVPLGITLDEVSVDITTNEPPSGGLQIVGIWAYEIYIQ